MQALALGKDFDGHPAIRPAGSARIGHRDVELCLVGIAEPTFDPDDPRNARRLLLRVESFTCNFRDRAIALFMFERLGRDRDGMVNFFGSEFCARVVGVGSEVRAYSPGDRVMADNTYPRRPVTGAKGGIPTNHASRGWLLMDEDQVTRVPDAMPNADAAAFALGGQTAMSMVRRAEVGRGDRVLVTSGRSNTSMFVTQILAAVQADVTVVSTGRWTPEQRDLLPPGTRLVEGDAEALEDDSFAAVLDPFFDLNLDLALRTLDFGGRYVTCGMQNQHASFTSPERTSLQLMEVLNIAMLKNLALHGNCIGKREDLRAAIELYTDGNVAVPIDSTFTIDEGSAFVERSFSDGGRVGKVIMDYARAAEG